jgi:hypothetical protein
VGGAAGRGLVGFGTNGVFNQGGNGAGHPVGYAGGGGGGGGFYGGGGGGGSVIQSPVGGGGGGGGANHIAAGVSNAVIKVGYSIDPKVEITYVDDVAPQPTISVPEISARPDFTGTAGKGAGDSEQLEIAIYSAANTQPGAPPVQTLTATRDADGHWSATPSPLAPGNYTAIVTQRDTANNVGRHLVLFKVIAQPQPVPTVTPAPAPAPPSAAKPAAPASPAAPAAALPKPAVVAPALRIDIKRARLTRRGLSVRLTCLGLRGRRCSGQLKLTAGKRTLGTARYTLPAGQTKTVRVPVRATTLPRRVTVSAGASTRTITLR